MDPKISEPTEQSPSTTLGELAANAQAAATDPLPEADPAEVVDAPSVTADADSPVAGTVETTAPAGTKPYRTLVVVNHGPDGQQQRYEAGQPIDLTDDEAAPLLTMRAVEPAAIPDNDAL